jgi:hydroxymethylpyrimidine pyrophosphatase-like HAD family hydrolase
METMNTAVLFDIDVTLTPPRQPITADMVKIIDRLNIPFGVAGGSHLDLLMKQFFEPMFLHGYRKQFTAFLSNGAIEYACDLSESISVSVVKTFDIRKHLGEEDYGFLINTLEATLKEPEFRLPSDLEVYGDTIAFRGSMVNMAPIGRLKIEGPEAQDNRKNFVRFDTETGYRLSVMAHLNKLLSQLIDKKDLKITLGGQTSFDIGIRGKDKTNAVTSFFEAGYQHVIFFGDALFEGGNDYSIREMEQSWPAESPQTLEAIQVESYDDTVKKLSDFGFLS